VSRFFLSRLRLSQKFNKNYQGPFGFNFSTKIEGDFSGASSEIHGGYDHLKRKSISSTDSDLSDLEETVEFYKEDKGRKIRRNETRIIVDEEPETESREITNKENDISSHFLIDRNFKCKSKFIKKFFINENKFLFFK
jgi:hypothetical protein